jgi:homotetrameric cytidine deaminase
MEPDPEPAQGDAIDSFRGVFEFLSNFYEHPIVVDGITYPTSEHAFQAMKVREEQSVYRYNIQNAPTPAAAKARGKKVPLREDWQEARFREMERVLRVKFSDPELRRKLLETGDRPLIEGNTWRDTTWGCIRDKDGAWKGRNELGRLLMCLREEFRHGEGAEADRVPVEQAITELIQAAMAARENAYAPYSKYRVGAAVCSSEGRIFGGANVENASYGLCNCAERTAVFMAVVAGVREITAVAVVTENGGSPCGACRQVLAEFVPKDGTPMEVFLCDGSGTILRKTTLSELFPFAFAL